MDYKASVTIIDKPGNLKGLASVSVGEGFAVTGIRILEGENGLFVSMPSRKTEGGYKDICFPTTKESREELHNAVMEAYEYKLEHREEQTNEKGKESKKSAKGKSQKCQADQSQDEQSAADAQEQDEQTEATPEMSM